MQADLDDVKVDSLGIELARRGSLKEGALDVDLFIPLHKVVLDNRLLCVVGCIEDSNNNKIIIK